MTAKTHEDDSPMWKAYLEQRERDLEARVVDLERALQECAGAKITAQDRVADLEAEVEKLREDKRGDGETIRHWINKFLEAQAIADAADPDARYPHPYHEVESEKVDES